MTLIKNTIGLRYSQVTIIIKNTPWCSNSVIKNTVSNCIFTLNVD